MTTLVEFSLPYYLRKSVKASVEVDSSIVESAPNIVICTSYGYLYEIKDEKIVNSLNLNKEIASEISWTCVAEKGRLLLFYLVRTVSNKFYIIKRSDCLLEVTKIFENVKSFLVEDYKLVGYPQIKLIFTTSDSCEVDFPIEDTKEVPDELQYDKDLEAKTVSLAKTLQILSIHIETLRQELYSVRKLCQPSNSTANLHLTPVDSVNFSLPFNISNYKITVLTKWIQILSGKLLLGMEISNIGKETISEFEFQIHDEMIKDYSYRFFASNEINKDFLLSSETMVTSIQPEQKITIVGVVSLALLDFSITTKLQLSCYLSSAELKDHLLKETFEVSMPDIIQHSKSFFLMLEAGCSIRDVHAIRAVKLETKLKIESRHVGADAMATLLQKNLKFERVRHKEIELYYCISTYLNEVFVAVLPLSVNESAWKVILYTSDESQICFLVGLFYEFLPDCTTILLDED